MSVAKLIGETLQRRGTLHVELLSRDGVGGSGDSLSGGARGQGGLADLAQVGDIPKKLYQKQRTSTKADKNQLQTIFSSFLGRAQRASSFGVEFVKNYPYSQYSVFFLRSSTCAVHKQCT